MFFKETITTYISSPMFLIAQTMLKQDFSFLHALP